ncbi:DUF1178 family protein [Novosphingobium pokkalii]|uniref:DUF1178 family protein n=1 Tax=Novosphingobium pokkalii TaxID=1770194 RepID=A0ABV7V3X3_9SPHN|nr:DUF1178 family protein [Novosphingobium pokkalii]GHC93196.1 hypothetical protein GCM10019060_19920 [Novosphingobium pokkalii]
MIVFDLQCSAGQHRFEGWFASSSDYAQQQERGLVTCPVCGSGEVVKAVMAPAVGRKGNQAPALPVAAPADGAASAAVAAPAGAAPKAPLPPEAVAMLRAVALAQAEAIKSSTWVGTSFAEDARAMHYGDKDAAPIHGQATPEEARDLLEEGIAVAPLLIPVVPPGEAN